MTSMAADNDKIEWKVSQGIDAPEETAALAHPQPGGLASSCCGRSPASRAANPYLPQQSQEEDQNPDLLCH